LWSMKWLWITIFSFSFLQAAFEFRYSGARPDALAGSYTAIADGVAGIVFNPAAVANLEQREISAYYNYLYSSLDSGLKGISLMAGPLNVLKGKLAIAIIRLSANFDDWGTYAENTLVLSHGFFISSNLMAGVSLNIYYLQNPGDLGNASTAGLDIGMLANFYRRWRLGLFIHNLNKPTLNASGGREELPLWISAGVSFRAGRYSLTSVDFRKSRDQDLRISIGEEVELMERVKIRAGVLSEGDLFKFSSGIGASMGRFGLDYAIIFDPDLPLTHTVSFRFIP